MEACSIKTRRESGKDLLVVQVSGTLTMEHADRAIQPCFNDMFRSSRVVMEIGNQQDTDYHPQMYLTCMLHRFAVLFKKEFSITCEDSELFRIISECAGEYRETGCVYRRDRSCIMCEEKLAKVG